MRAQCKLKKKKHGNTKPTRVTKNNRRNQNNRWGNKRKAREKSREGHNYKPMHQHLEEEETDKTKQAQTEQTNENHHSHRCTNHRCTKKKKKKKKKKRSATQKPPWNGMQKQSYWEFQPVLLAHKTLSEKQNSSLKGKKWFSRWASFFL